MVAQSAQVVLQVIDPPRGVGVGVLLLVTKRPLEMGAGLRSRRGIDADLQPLGMNVVGQSLHVGELLVGLDVSLRVALAFPGVVDVDIGVPSRRHAGGDQRIGGPPHVSLVTFPAKWFQLFHPIGGVAASFCPEAREVSDNEMAKRARRNCGGTFKAGSFGKEEVYRTSGGAG